LRRELQAKGIKMRSARGVVCTPLDRITRISSVAPEVWSDTCKRQGSWYRASDKSGLYLVVSAFELEDFDHKKAGTITASDFVPPRLATEEEKAALCEDPTMKRCLPEDWGNVTPLERKIYLRWAKRFGSDTESFDFLYLSHTANHANFITPRLFVEGKNGMVPFSIDRSAHLCSSCIELFQILGGSYDKKFVAPCPGAVLFARLAPDRYLLVEKATAGA
jgi:hypothetical protein